MWMLGSIFLKNVSCSSKTVPNALVPTAARSGRLVVPFALNVPGQCHGNMENTGSREPEDDVPLPLTSALLVVTSALLVVTRS